MTSCSRCLETGLKHQRVRHEFGSAEKRSLGDLEPLGGAQQILGPSPCPCGCGGKDGEAQGHQRVRRKRDFLSFCCFRGAAVVVQGREAEPG